MKKLFPLFMIFALVLAFSSCSDSGSSNDASSEMKAAASAASQAAMAAAFNAMSGADNVRALQTVIEDTDSTDPTNVVSFELLMDPDTGDMAIDCQMTFTNYTDGEVTLNGSMTVYFSVDGTTYDMSGTEIGTLTVNYQGQTFVMIIDIDIESSDDSVTISGSVTVDGEKYDIDESLS